MDDWFDDDIAALDLTEVEKNGLQLYRNYTRAFQKDRAGRLASHPFTVAFDVDGLEADLKSLVERDATTAVLAAIGMADDLLVEMFRREARERLEMKVMLGPLGPLGDFNKRLKIAALSDFIDDDDLVYFDELRKLRNKIAHSPRPKVPSRHEFQRFDEIAPEWIDVMCKEGVLASSIDRYTEAVFKAGLVMHLAKLAWGCLFRPLAKRADVPIKTVIEKRPDPFDQISRVGVLLATSLLRTEK